MKRWIRKHIRNLKKRIAGAVIQYALDQLAISPAVLAELERRTKLPPAVVRIIAEIVFDSLVRALNDALEHYEYADE